MPLLEIYQDFLGFWRWRLTDPNGQIIALSQRPYTERRGAIQDARETVEHFGDYATNWDEGDPDSYNTEGS